MAETLYNTNLALFNPFLLQCYPFHTKTPNPRKSPTSVQWVMRYGEEGLTLRLIGRVRTAVCFKD
eukprot:1159926-Pelagomonas_calceolata.AAC.6